MKNIHVLKTEKPSRLRYNLSYILVLTKEAYRDYRKQVNQNIYITSDEEIKERDWFLGANNIVYKFTSDDVKNGFKPKGKKIILTTDQDLIKDGVQAIDDEFLEWFVKNPNCEWVEIREGFANGTSYGYKIIIPKEEPKQDLEKEMFELEQELDIPSHLKWHNSKLKQELLEEAAEKYATNHGMMAYVFPEKKESFIEGAKWQAEQDKNKYSDDDMMFAYEQGARLALLSQFPLARHKGEFPKPKDWFEQFKKK